MTKKSRAAELIEGNTREGLVSIAQGNSITVPSKANKNEIAKLIVKGEKTKKPEPEVTKTKGEY